MNKNYLIYALSLCGAGTCYGNPGHCDSPYKVRHRARGQSAIDFEGRCRVNMSRIAQRRLLRSVEERFSAIRLQLQAGDVIDGDALQSCLRQAYQLLPYVTEGDYREGLEWIIATLESLPETQAAHVLVAIANKENRC